MCFQTAAEISKTALDNSDPLAVEAVDIFLALIGAEAGHMGLRSLASGGVYICGGIMPKVPFSIGWNKQPIVLDCRSVLLSITSVIC